MFFKAPLNQYNFLILFPEVRCAYFGDLETEHVKGFWASVYFCTLIFCSANQYCMPPTWYVVAGTCRTACWEESGAQVRLIPSGFLQSGLWVGMGDRLRKLQLN